MLTQGLSVISTKGHYPYGEYCYSSGLPSKFWLTSFERDSGAGESGNDYAMFRHCRVAHGLRSKGWEGVIGFQRGCRMLVGLKP